MPSASSQGGKRKQASETCHPASRGSAYLRRAIADHVSVRVPPRIARERVLERVPTGAIADHIFVPRAVPDPAAPSEYPAYSTEETSSRSELGSEDPDASSVSQLVALIEQIRDVKPELEPTIFLRQLKGVGEA